MQKREHYAYLQTIGNKYAATMSTNEKLQFLREIYGPTELWKQCLSVQ